MYKSQVKQPQLKQRGSQILGGGYRADDGSKQSSAKKWPAGQSHAKAPGNWPGLAC